MIDRICISINNRCNLSCDYCHFLEKDPVIENDMDVFQILDNVAKYAKGSLFKIGFVGNGEPLLDFPLLRDYLTYLERYPNIHCYTITNGTIDLEDREWKFLVDHGVNVGFSLDGPKEIHDRYRNDTFDIVMRTIEHYRTATGHYPTFNSTVGWETLDRADEVIAFFLPYGTRVTFSRCIGRTGIPLDKYRCFLSQAEESGLSVRRGGEDCTMYGGLCGAGINNFFYANGSIFYCGNCIGLAPVAESSAPLESLECPALKFNRTKCFKESLCG